MTPVTAIFRQASYHTGMKTKSGLSAASLKELFTFRSLLLKELKKFELAIVRLQYEGKVHHKKNLATAADLFRRLELPLLRHMKSEDKVIFPFVQTHIPKTQPAIELFKGEHQMIRRYLKLADHVLQKSADASSIQPKQLLLIRETSGRLTELLRKHLHQENDSIYNLIHKLLHADEKALLENKLLHI